MLHTLLFIEHWQQPSIHMHTLLVVHDVIKTSTGYEYSSSKLQLKLESNKKPLITLQ